MENVKSFLKFVLVIVILAALAAFGLSFFLTDASYKTLFGMGLITMLLLYGTLKVSYVLLKLLLIVALVALVYFCFV